MSNCVPEKIASDDASNGKPGTDTPVTTGRIVTHKNINNPSRVTVEPIMVANLSGTVL